MVSERYNEVHEEAAEAFVVAAAAVFLVFLVATWIRREATARAVGRLTVVGTLAVLALGVSVGQAGGALV